MSLRPLTPVEILFPEFKQPELLITSRSSVACTLFVRGFTPHGLIDISHVCNTDRSAKETQHKIPGLPSSLYVGVITGNPKRGTTYVSVILRLGGVRVGVLAQGYVYLGRDLSWPWGTIEGSLEGRGYIKFVESSDPSAGAEASITVPTNARWRIISAYIILATDATSVDRVPHLLVDNGQKIVVDSVVAAAIQASSSARLCWMAGAGYGRYDQNSQTMPLPVDCYAYAGWRIRTDTTSLQAGDDYTSLKLAVEEWIEE